MNSPATAPPPGRSRLALIVACVLALLGSFVVTAPAQAGYYGESYYGSNPCSYRCGYSPYRYAPRYYPRYSYYPRYNNGCSSCGCSSCGCYRRCYSGSRSGLVYERRYVEREYVERRYGWRAHHYYRPHYGYYPCEGCRSYSPYEEGYRSYSRPFPYGYGGVRGWRTPYGYRYEPSRYEEEEEAPRPPAPVLDEGRYDEGRYEAVPYGNESAHWNGGQAYGAEDVSGPLPRGPLGMLASSMLGFLATR